MYTLENAGLFVRDLILFFASVLREDAAPGIASIGIILITLVSLALVLLRTARQNTSIGWARRVICSAPDRQAFANQFIEIHQQFLNARDGKNRVGSRTNRRSLAVAWGEYHETMVIPDAHSGEVLKNSVRPYIFFDADDLGFGPGLWKILPGLLITFGLFLTFLGLIAALTAIGGDEITDESLQGLLNAASAKFIMSLTGLLCSIIATIAIRTAGASTDSALRNLCHEIEKRLRFQTSEDLALQQLRALENQESVLQSMATEIVAELARPLKEEVPEAIGASIRDELAPLLKSLGETSEQGLGNMVGDISEKLSGDVERALANASEKLSGSAGQLTELLGSMQGSASQMSTEMERAISSAGASLSEAALEIAAPLENILDRMERVAQLTQSSAQELKTFADTARASGETISSSSREFRSAAVAMSEVASPLLESVQSLEESSQEIASKITEALATNQKQSAETATRTQEALQAAREILGNHHQGVSSAMDGLAIALRELENQGGRIDDLDVKLGAAFENYRSHVEATMQDAAGKVREIVEILNPALDTMKSVVESAEEYIPSSDRKTSE